MFMIECPFRSVGVYAGNDYACQRVVKSAATQNQRIMFLYVSEGAIGLLV